MSINSIDFDRGMLIRKTRRGEVTLVIGAGVSRPFGIPNWNTLAQRLWARAFPDTPSPWDASDSQSPLYLPQFLPIVFERAAEVLNKEDSNGFVTTLREAIYAEAKRLPKAEETEDATESLVVLAKVLVQEYQRYGERRIQRVVTLNIDSLLEMLTNRLMPGKPGKRPKVVRSISRATQEPLPSDYASRYNKGPGKQPIPIYHIHGNIPNYRTVLTNE